MIASMIVLPLAGCVAAPLFDEFLVDSYERVPPHPTLQPDESAPPEESAYPDPLPIATNMPTDSPDSGGDPANGPSETASEPGGPPRELDRHAAEIPSRADH